MKQQPPCWSPVAPVRGIAVAGLMAGFVALSSCGFNVPLTPSFDPCKDLGQIVPAQANTPAPTDAFELIGSIKVMHGVTRAVSADAKAFSRVEQTVEIPPYTNEATVVLNGWEAAYNDSDHHIGYMATVLGHIQVVPGTQGTPGKITWNAIGYLSDNDGAEAFTWTYRYTIIAWNTAFVPAIVDHNDAERFCASGETNGDDNFFIADNAGTNPADAATTALSSFSSFLTNGRFASGRQVAVLPRGFAFFWLTYDHHLLQLAYNLESAAPFVRAQSYNKAVSTIDPLGNSATSQAGGEFVSWKTSVIMKDNSRRRDYSFVEFVSGIAGPNVEIVQPELTVLPREDTGGVSSGASLKSADVVIGNLPYVAAVPVLTGWDIGYARDDQHVKQLGIFLENVKYERPPVSPVGTLRYRVSSIVKDNDNVPDNYFRHKVSILGFR